ncbi:pulmonary surfactant-associated protein A-like [Leptodactylus fuscus]|uniref:pulmonary surfactant-associated protein A-like n=1 Tax=Leptodactylus fuscus TaxID=238119 RepID=UPI003F4E77FF
MMLRHGSLLLIVAVSLASCLPFGLPSLPNLPNVPDLPVGPSLSIPSLPAVVPEIPGVTGGGILAGVPSAGGSGNQDLQNRINKLEAVLKLQENILMVGDKIIATSGKEVDFATSKSTCKELGGQIVTPMNEAENIAVMQLAKKFNRYPYIGFQEGVVPGQFNTLNGVPATYTRWRKGEPSGKGTESCVEMYTDGQWNDKACNQNRLTICEL